MSFPTLRLVASGKPGTGQLSCQWRLYCRPHAGCGHGGRDRKSAILAHVPHVEGRCGDRPGGLEITAPGIVRPVGYGSPAKSGQPRRSLEPRGHSEAHRVLRWGVIVGGTLAPPDFGDELQPGDCGPVVSLRRRDGSNPLRRRLFWPVTKLRGTSPPLTPCGVLSRHSRRIPTRAPGFIEASPNDSPQPVPAGALGALRHRAKFFSPPWGGMRCLAGPDG